MDLNKHIVTDKNNSTLHSSGFARVASGDRLGSTSSESFNQRLNIDRNRQLVGNYRRSTLGNARGVLRAKTYTRTPAEPSIQSNKSLQQNNSISANTPHRFSEPTTRVYNPYS